MTLLNRANWSRRARGALLMLGVISAAAAQCAAQQLKFAIERPPYYIDQPVKLQLAATGFEEQPQPVIEVMDELAESLNLTLIGVSPQVSQSISNINGRVTHSRNVVFKYTYTVTSSAGGEFSVGPFKVTQAGKEATSGRATVEFEEVPLVDNMQVGFEFADGTFYLGERIPITIRWSYEGNLQRLGNLNIRAPALDQFDVQPVQMPDQRVMLTVFTERGAMKLPASEKSAGYSGNESLEYVARAEMVADRVGEFEFPPITASVEEVTQWSRDPTGDLFGGFGIMGPRRASEARLVRAVGKPLKLSIKPLPTAGRPASFSGAVGDQYGIEVEANRSVVRVGDPISLTVTLLGNGALKNAQLPDLSADGGMSPDKFRLPADLPAGVFQDGRRQFAVNVRVTDESVKEIPALAYSWFDPVSERYETARSNPIALRVLPSQVISADDVISANPPQENERPPGLASKSPSESHHARPPGLDLSIEEDLSKLTGGAPKSAIWMLGGPYLLGLLAIVWAIVDRRRTAAAASGGNLHRQLAERVQQISQAQEFGKPETATHVAGALRDLLPHASARQRETADRLIGQLEALIFAPKGVDNGSLDRQLLQDAEEVAKQIVATAGRSRESG